MKILICIPVVKNGIVLRECVDQILYKRNVHIIILDNGADPDVKEVLYHYDQYPQVTLWHNSINKFVTNPWNTFLDYFIKSDYDKLIILNSDLTLNQDWHMICTSIWKENPDYVLVPTIITDKRKCFTTVPTNLAQPKSMIKINEGIAGVFITLSKEQAKLVYPIDERIKIWFNDNWLFQQLVAFGYSIIVVEELQAFHHVSTNISAIDGALQIIEEDKIAWNTQVKLELEKRIQKIKNSL